MYEPTDAEELEDPYWGNPIRRTMEEERVKEQIKYLLEDKDAHFTANRIIADQILSIKGIRIESDDQGLPSVRNAVNKSYNDYMLGQEDMLKAGFIKCERREDGS